MPCLLQKILILSKGLSVELVFDFVPQITETRDRLSKSETIDAEIRGCVPAPKPMVPGNFLVDGPPTPPHRHSATPPLRLISVNVIQTSSFVTCLPRERRFASDNIKVVANVEEVKLLLGRV